jgi:predicted dehydrogenase
VSLAQVRAGVVGVGFIGVAHVEALRRLGVQVTGVAGSSPERARAKAAAANLPRVHDSVEALVAAPDVDVVHVATPNRLHSQQVLAALDAGKHVVCEKPLGLTSRETAGMVARAAAAGVVNAVCFNIRFYALCHHMRAMVAAGDIGSPRLVTGSYLQDWLLEPTDWNWRLEPESGGALRAVADIGSHWLDLARFVTGRRVVAAMADLHTTVPVRRHPPGPVETFAAPSGDAAEEITETMTSDDAAGVLLRFEDGVRGTLAISQVSAGRKNAVSIEVDGSEGALWWSSEDPDRLWIGHRGRPNGWLARDAALMAPEAAAVTAYPPGHIEGYADTFRGLFAQVYADVARDGSVPTPAYPTFADGHDAVCVTEAIATSSAERRWVDVDRS